MPRFFFWHSAGACRPWRRPWRSRLCQHRHLRLHCRVLRRGRSRGKEGGGRRSKKVIALWLSRSPMLFFDPPGVFGLKLPKAFVPKGVGEELLVWIHISFVSRTIVLQSARATGPTAARANSHSCAARRAGDIQPDLHLQYRAVPEPRPEKLGKFCKIPTVRRVQGPRRALKLNLPRCPEGQGKSERERKESAPQKKQNDKCESRMWSARITVVCGCVRSARSDLHTSEFSHLRICVVAHTNPHTLANTHPGSPVPHPSSPAHAPSLEMNPRADL